MEVGREYYPPTHFKLKVGHLRPAGVACSNSAHCEKSFLGGEDLAKTKKGITTKETIKRATIKDMKTLGIHKPQYNRLISIYAETVHQYLRAVSDFAESEYQYETETAAGNPKKSGIVSAMESLRKDILQYSDRLCLNPKSLETIKIEQGGKSTLASMLDKFER